MISLSRPLDRLSRRRHNMECIHSFSSQRYRDSIRKSGKRHWNPISANHAMPASIFCRRKTNWPRLPVWGRNTLRRVISVLQDDGIVRRIQGKGTFIEEAPVTISFYNWLVYQNADTNPRLLMDRWFREFQSESGVNVDNVAVNYSLYSHALHDALLDAVQPDLVLITPFWFHSFQRMKLFRNLDDYLGRPVFADVYNPALEMMKNRDRIYGVPWGSGPFGALLQQKCFGSGRSKSGKKRRKRSTNWPPCAERSKKTVRHRGFVSP